MSLISRCQKILQVPSVSSYRPREHIGTKAVAEFLAKEFEPHLNVKVERVKGHSKDRLFFAWPKGQKFSKRPDLVLHTHLDTVSPGPLSAWTNGGPFEGRIENEILIGLGAADVKCDAICKLTALSQYDSSSKKMPMFVGSFNEETDMSGAAEIIKRVRPLWALVGEPSELNFCYANKGFGVFRGTIPIKWKKNSFHRRVSFSGKQAHSSAPHKGDNALEAFLRTLNEKSLVATVGGCIGANTIPGSFNAESGNKVINPEALVKLKEIFNAHQKWLQKISRRKTSDFDPPTTTSQWTELLIEKKTLVFTIDFRWLPGQSAKALTVEFLNPFKKYLQFIAETDACFEKPVSAFGKWLRPLFSERQRWITKTGGNEASFYQRIGAHVYVVAPGESYGNVHKPNEHIALKSLEDAHTFYSQVLQKLSG